MQLLRLAALLAGAAQVYAVHLRVFSEHLDDPVPHYRTVYHAKEEVPELGTQLYCCVNLTLQYFFIYTALALVSTYADLRLGVRSAVVSGLKSVLTQCAQTVAAGPMLAVLFLVLEMRFKAAGRALPAYAAPWMLTATYALGFQTLMVLCLPVATGEIVECDDEGTLKSPAAAYGYLAKAILALRYGTLAALYAGIGGCLYALFGPDSPRGLSQTPPAVNCVALLCALYFLTALVLILVRELSGSMRATAALQVTFSVASMAPMVAIVFVALRVRAFQVAPDGNPQGWAQTCMYVATGSLLAQALLVLVCAALGGEPLKARGDGDFGATNLRPSLYLPLTVGRYLAVGVMFGCLLAAMASAFLLEGEARKAPPVSPAVQNTFVLALAFFLVYLVLFVLNTLRDVLYHKLQDGYPGSMGRLDARAQHAAREASWIKWIKTAENARLTVQFSPMLAVLFLAVRVRALQVTDRQGGPQGWAQVSMAVCTGSVLVQLLMVVGVAALVDKYPETSKTGVVITQPSNAWLRIPLTLVRYVAFVGLYGGLIAVLASIFLIRPETATALLALPH
jgi:hypothetical protein